MFWKLFGSDRKVEAALEQSIGYDISPNVIAFPTNDNPQFQTLTDNTTFTPAGQKKTA